MKFKKIIPAIGYATVFFLLILDAKNAIQAAAEGIQICLQTVIPSLFPFLVICPLLTSRIPTFTGFPGSAIARLCGIPKGSENIFIIGLLGGFPIGAQIVEQAYQNRILTTVEAKRMLAFCNNAGPAFILGIGAALFQNAYIPFILWGIQIISTILVALVLPQRASGICRNISGQELTLSKAVSAAVRSMAGICGWVVTFRILLSILQRWILWLLSPTQQILVAGVLELSNGCIALQQLSDPSIKFILCTAFLSFGGLCVWMQTLSVSPTLRGGRFFIGRCLHLAYSLSLAFLAQFLLFPSRAIPFTWPVTLLWATTICVTFFYKKGIAFPKNMLYNKKKSVIEVDYVISQKDTA